MEIQRPDFTTGSSFQQQAGMVRFLAEELGAGVRYVPMGDHCIAVVTLASGRVHRFDVYGGHEAA